MQRIVSQWGHWVVSALIVVSLCSCSGKSPDASMAEESAAKQPELTWSPLSWLLVLAAPIRPEQPNTVASLEAQAKRFQARGKYDLAEKQYRLALRIREQAWPPGDSHITPGLDKVAAFYMARGRYQEAEPLLRQALEIRTNNPDTLPRDRAATLEKLAELLRKTQREEEATRLEAQAKALRGP